MKNSHKCVGVILFGTSDLEHLLNKEATLQCWFLEFRWNEPNPYQLHMGWGSPRTSKNILLLAKHECHPCPRPVLSKRPLEHHSQTGLKSIFLLKYLKNVSQISINLLQRVFISHVDTYNSDTLSRLENSSIKPAHCVPLIPPLQWCLRFEQPSTWFCSRAEGLQLGK